MKSLDLIFDETRRQLGLQFRTIESIDGKIGIMIGFTGVILGIVARMEKTLLLEIGMGLLSGSLILGIMSFWFRKYWADPNPEGLERKYLTEENIKTKRQILANYVSSYNKNHETLTNKMRAAKWAFGFLLSGILSVIVQYFL